MRGALQIGSVRGISLRLHFSFLLVLPLLAFLFARQLTTAARLADVPPEALSGYPFIWGLGLAIALFLGVLIHELAHAFYALRTGGQVRSITLLMIGGVSEVTEPPKRLRDEALMALVGPLVSLALGVGFLLLFRLVRESLPSFNARFALFYLGQINLMLGLFNLLPAFPMDGGRVLRAMLASRLGMARGTQIAATLGKGFAIFFAVTGILTFNFVLLFVAYFVYLGALSESRQVQVRTLLGKVTLRDLVLRSTTTAEGVEPVSQVAERMLAERRTALPVVEGDQVVGMTTLQDVQAVPPEQRPQKRTRDITRTVPLISIEDEVWQAVRKLEQAGLSQLPVVQEGRLIGVLRHEDVMRGLKLQELQDSQRQPPRPPLRSDGEIPV